MKAAYHIQNRSCDLLEVWVEPWCHPYRVPRDSVLRLSYVATRHALVTEFTPDGIAVWTNSRDEPSAELDGVAIAPDFS